MAEENVKGAQVQPAYPEASSTAADRGRAGERLAASQDPSSRSQVQPADNEQLTNQLHQQVLGKTGTIQLGTIIYAVPFVAWYRVHLDQGGDLPCCQASESSSQPFSAFPGHVLSPRTQVIVWVPAMSRWGYILGAVPRVVVDNEKFLPDWVSQGANMGFQVEDYYGKKLFTIPDRCGGLIDWSDGRPLAGTGLGEWSRFTHLGNGIFIDPFMVFMRTDETCGLWLHYFDRLARLSGYNLDVRTSISEAVTRNDEYEGMFYRGTTPYPWEALASFKPKKEVHTENTDKAVQYDEPWYGKYEPKEDDYQPFWRLEEFEGYLGQAYMRQVVLPPEGPPDFNRYSDDNKRFGAFREQIGLDGSYALQSLHSITMMKRCLIPIPKQQKLPEDDTGDVGDGPDTTSNYKFAGQFGNGDDHKIRGHPEAQGELKNVLSATGLLDGMAYTYNWKGLHPFHYHKKDFDTPQEHQVPKFSKIQEAPEFGQLMSKTFIDQPSPTTGIYVDERDGYKSAEFWETTAGWAILPDGGFVLRDGYGGEILMTGGNIHISCPGDTFFRPGRSFIVWGGDDVILRAKKSLDLSTAEKNISIKAEQNLEMLSGNSGQGRTLIENRGFGVDHEDAGKIGEDIEQECGVIIKAKWSEFATMSRRVYIRTGNVEGEISEGEIVLDAAKGKQAIRMVANELDMHLESAAYMSFPAQTPRKSAVYRFHPTLFLAPCSMMVKGYLQAEQDIISFKNLQAAGGHIFTSVKSPHVWDYKGSPPVSHIEDEHIVGVDLTTQRWSDITQNYWEGTRIGADETQKKVEFGFRDTAQYATGNFRLPESYWQQWTRMGASGNQTWTERPVRYQNSDTFPYPGKEKWKDEEVFMEVDFQLWDVDSLRDKDRDGPYKEPKMKWNQKKKLDGYYQTITPS